MVAQTESHRTDLCKKGGDPPVENQQETLSEITGLPARNKCTILNTPKRGGAIMKMTPDQDHERKEGLLRDGEAMESETMRGFIIEVAKRLEDEKLLKMLYIRAKTLNHM